MAFLICKLTGVRGRYMEVYDTKCIIRTEVTAGSFLTGNATDGEKTIFYIDCTGIQFKPSKFAIGYLQIETPSMQMNNQGSNFFSENTFTFEEGKNQVTNALMTEIYHFIANRVEGYKYGTNTAPLTQVPEHLAAMLPRGSMPMPTGAWTCNRCGAPNPDGKFCQTCGNVRQ